MPREIPPEQYVADVREFCREQFVSKGMCWILQSMTKILRDKPHAHVMLTMRAMDEHGKWLPKSRKVYDLDRTGTIKLRPADGKATRKIRLTGTTASMEKSGGMNGRSSRTAIWKPTTARNEWISVLMKDRGLILSLPSMRGCCPADGKQGHPDAHR